MDAAIWSINYIALVISKCVCVVCVLRFLFFKWNQGWMCSEESDIN